MVIESDGTTAQPTVVAPIVTHERLRRDLEPSFAIQHYSSGAGFWRTWDCAYTRVEADNLLAYYQKRHGHRGEWRLAKIIYR